jgi:uncharacterized membrane protein required for colicin V production
VNTYYLFNLFAVSVIILFGLYGSRQGLFLELMNFMATTIAVLCSIHFMADLYPVIQQYFCPREEYAKVISLWILFLVPGIPLYGVATTLSYRYKISYYKALDWAGGLVFGTVCGIIGVSFLFLSLEMAPFFKLNESGVVAFDLDQLLVKKYDRMFARTGIDRDFSITEFRSSVSNLDK